jgi:hypothetical protein
LRRVALLLMVFLCLTKLAVSSLSATRTVLSRYFCASSFSGNLSFDKFYMLVMMVSDLFLKFRKSYSSDWSSILMVSRKTPSVRPMFR